MTVVLEGKAQYYLIIRIDLLLIDKRVPRVPKRVFIVINRVKSHITKCIFQSQNSSINYVIRYGGGGGYPEYDKGGQGRGGSLRRHKKG
jgi:hypothetical protein